MIAALGLGVVIRVKWSRTMPALKFHPALESLDARALPSAVLTAPTDPVPVVIAAPPASHPLQGAGQGEYTDPTFGHVDAGIAHSLHGTVALQGLGTFDLSGWVNGTGMILGGRATGHLVLTNATGSLTIELHGPVQPGFAPIPSDLVYSISGGTGAYAHAKGYGVTHLTFTPYPAPMPPVTPPAVPAVAAMPSAPTPVLCPMPMPQPGGHFNIAFS